MLMKIKNMLFLGLGCLFIVVVILSVVAINLMNQQVTIMEEIVSDRYQKVDLTNDIRYNIENIGLNSREMLLVEEKTKLDEYASKINGDHLELLSNLSLLKHISQEDEIVQTIAKLEVLYNTYQENQKQIINWVKEGKREDAHNLLLGDSWEVRNELTKLLAEITMYEENAMTTALIQSKEKNRNAVIMFSLFVLVGILTGGSIAALLIRNITGNMSRLTTAMKKLTLYEDKTSLPRLEIKTRDEIGEIAETFNSMVTALESFAKKERVFSASLQEQNWLKSHQTEISALFQGVQNIKNLAQLVISWTASTLGASYGVFYVSDCEKDNKILIKMGSYAGDGNEVGTPSIKFGEGLAGQCALENKMIKLNDIPQNYIAIKSSLGTTPPRNILVVPVEFEGEVLAVIELASLNDFTPLEQELLGEVCANIGTAINRIQGYMKVQKLLAESQALTEELQTQSEEMQQQQEELKVFNEKIDKQYQDAEKRNAELEEIKLALEEQTRQLALSSQYKTEFLSNMSHELRTPLNSLLILAQMLAENKAGNLTAKQVEYAKTILSSGNDLLDLINDILDLAKIEAGKLQVKPEQMSLLQLKDSLERQFKLLARNKGIDFQIQLADDIHRTFYTDEHRLMQILKNLLSNAVKFTGQGYVHLNIQRAKNTNPSIITFSVIDTGIGIAEDRQESIFEPFQQVDGTTSRKYGGTGLGLSICRELASLLGGHIELKSAEGKGSIFTLYLPPYDTETFESAIEEVAVTSDDNVPEDVADNVEICNQQELLKGRKVLVVDDDMRNVFAITAALEDQQIQVLFAENGREGVATLKNNPDIDLVLMDIMMPEMNGYEAMEIIRQDTTYEKLPIIALTAKAMKGDRDKCLEAGASDYISKPLDVDQLLSLMRVWLYRQVN
jgi:two-component system chemotaxis sensor kinase CheA